MSGILWGILIWIAGILVLLYCARWSTAEWATDEFSRLMSAFFWPFMPLVLLGLLGLEGVRAVARWLDRFIIFSILARVVERTPAGVLYQTRLPTSGPSDTRTINTRNFIVVQDPTTKRIYRHQLPQRTNGWTVDSALAWMAGLPPGEPYKPQWEG